MKNIQTLKYIRTRFVIIIMAYLYIILAHDERFERVYMVKTSPRRKVILNPKHLLVHIIFTFTLLRIYYKAQRN